MPGPELVKNTVAAAVDNDGADDIVLRLLLFRLMLTKIL